MSIPAVMSPNAPAAGLSGEPDRDPITPPTVRMGTPPFGADGHGGATILIAEDHEDSRDALRTLLDAFGYRVHVAVNGREAVERARALAPDLILMDMMMPEVDGFEATRTLRADPEFRQVPIIALTAMEGAREQVMAAGCDDFMCKPLDVRAFLDRVRTWIESGRPAAS
ncbi:MAG: two-component response regulator [Gemmatimonadetes bacterium]|nr:two-component response regulator [Gemmatimonadota bacterium]